MERRRRIIRTHKIILGVLAGTFGAMMFMIVGILMASDVINHDARVAASNFKLTYDVATTLSYTPAEVLEQGLAENYAHSKGIVYLTFDDGPGEHTDRLLDVLEKYNVKATFFVTGHGDDAAILREYEDGHTVALHTWSHNYAAVYNSIDSYFNDLDLVSERVKNITGEESKLIRFPGGSSNLVSRRYDGGIKIMSQLTKMVEEKGYQYFDWNLDSDDAGRANNSDQVFVNVAAHLKDGDNVVLQHDVQGFSVDAVERIIQYGLENGYKFLPLTLDSPTAHHGVNN